MYNSFFFCSVMIGRG